MSVMPAIDLSAMEGKGGVMYRVVYCLFVRILESTEFQATLISPVWPPAF
jgi:hypothetical protein